MTFFRHVPILYVKSAFTARRTHTKVVAEIWYHSPSQHITLLRLLQNQHQLVNTIDLILNTLNQRPKRIRNIIDERVTDPIARHTDIILQLLNPPPHVLWMWRRPEMKGEDTLAEDDDVHVEGLEVGRAVGILVEGAETDEVIGSEELDLFAGFFHLDIFCCERMDVEDLPDTTPHATC